MKTIFKNLRHLVQLIQLLKNVPRNDKRYCFQTKNNNSRTLHVFESAINHLPYLTLEKRKDSIFHRDNYLSID